MVERRSKFELVERKGDVGTLRSCFVLVKVDWNDYSFETSFDLIRIDHRGQVSEIGRVKIGDVSSNEPIYKTKLPRSFDDLPSNFVSLGVAASYYENLGKLGRSAQRKVLESLNDIALDPALFEEYKKFEVVEKSLFRYLNREKVRTYYRRLAEGDIQVRSFDFSFSPKDNMPANTFYFTGHARSFPPTNMHVLIGRNGVGKSTILHSMNKAVHHSEGASGGPMFKRVKDGTDDVRAQERLFPSHIHIAFSAFDGPIALGKGESDDTYLYVGLSDTDEDGNIVNRSPKQLSIDFLKTYEAVWNLGKEELAEQHFEVLKSDPLLNAGELIELMFAPTRSANSSTRLQKNVPKIQSLYNRLSSGHKIVLISLLKLVVYSSDGTLVLIDEPETHLHPPLLSKFITAMNALLSELNAVAIVATHSPVVLQETPRSCCWVIRRHGSVQRFNRPAIETYGENVGVLTHEVFGLEVTETGFYLEIEKRSKRGDTFEQVVADASGSLGSEAKAFARILTRPKS